MQNKKLSSILLELGLSDKESAIYLAALVLGPSSASEIARESGIKRPTVYPIVDALTKKGLMHIEVRGFKQLYAAEPPERLKSALATKANMLSLALPEFEALYNLRGDQGVVRYYRGLDAVKGVYEDLLKDTRPKDDYWVISHTKKWLALDEKYFRDFAERQTKERFNFRFLLVDSPEARASIPVARAIGAEVRILPKDTVFGSNFTATAHRTVMHHLEEPTFAIVVDNDQFARMQRELFEVVWQSLGQDQQSG